MYQKVVLLGRTAERVHHLSKLVTAMACANRRCRNDLSGIPDKEGQKRYLSYPKGRFGLKDRVGTTK
jgi:hypothetical protein